MRSSTGRTATVALERVAAPEAAPRAEPDEVGVELYIVPASPRRWRSLASSLVTNRRDTNTPTAATAPRRQMANRRLSVMARSVVSVLLVDGSLAHRDSPSDPHRRDPLDGVESQHLEPQRDAQKRVARAGLE